MPERPVVVFDVNETLLDLDSINPVFTRIFDDPAAMRLWFADLILYSEALTIAGVYVPFTDIGAAVLRMLAATRGLAVSDADAAWSARWEERSHLRGKPNQVIGWKAGDEGSLLGVESYQKLEGDWVDGKDPAASA